MDASARALVDRRALWATATVAAVMALVVVGGFVVADALAGPQGAPVEVAGVVRVEPLRGWELAERFTDPPGVRLTRGGASLDVIAARSPGPAPALARSYVRDVLEPQARQLSVSRTAEPVRLASGLPGVRVGYVGLFGRAEVPIEGELTAVVSPSGVGVVFDGWSTEGLMRFVVDDLREMTDAAEVA